jgi:hypothetical protein
MKYTYETKESDNFRTPKYAWRDIRHLIPKNKAIWEAFPGDFKSAEYLRELGFRVVADNADFFKHDLGDVVVSTPPFSITKQVLCRLKLLDKPFILIMPSSKMNSDHFRELFRNEIQIIVPKKRMHFEKYDTEEFKRNCSFDCFYYCYKMGLPKDLVWLD